MGELLPTQREEKKAGEPGRVLKNGLNSPEMETSVRKKLKITPS